MLPRILWYYRVSMKNYRLDKGELKALQLAKMRRLVKFGYTNVRLYRERMKALGITPDDIASLSDIKALPILSRADIALGDKGVFVPGIPVGMTRTTSGTTTGKPMKLLWGAKYCDILNGIKMRKMRMAGIGFQERGVVVQLPTSYAFNDRRFLNVTGLRALLFGSFATNLAVMRLDKVLFRPGSLKASAHQLRRTRPDVVNMHASFLRRMGHVLAEEGTPIDIRTLIVGEMLTSDCRGDLKALFSPDRILMSYGATEFGHLGSECSYRRGMHLSSDHCYFEFVGKDGEEPAPGERCELIITCFDNWAMPLIRYKIGDIVKRADDEVCGCGSSFPRISYVEGRAADSLVDSYGVRVPPYPIRDYIENGLHLRDYQVEQKGRDRVVVRLLDVQSNPEVKSRLTKFLKETLGEKVGVEFEEWTVYDLRDRHRFLIGPKEPVAA